VTARHQVQGAEQAAMRRRRRSAMARTSGRAAGASRPAAASSGGWRRPVGSGGRADDLLFESGAFPAAFVSAFGEFPRRPCVDSAPPVRVPLPLKRRLAWLRASRSVLLLTEPGVCTKPNDRVVGRYWGAQPQQCARSVGRSWTCSCLSVEATRRWHGLRGRAGAPDHEPIAVSSVPAV
jgi:hypothetical protein